MRRFTAILSLLFLGTNLYAEQAMEPGSYDRTFASSKDGSEQPYQLHIPTKADGATALPAVIVLHGKGATWQSWFAATNIREVADQEGWVAISPHGRGDWFYLGPGESDVLDALEDAAALTPIDRDRVYIIGHSMGGFGAAHLAAAHPEIFAAGVPMATWPPTELMTNFRNRPLVLIHGDADIPVPILGSERAVAALKLNQVPHEFLIVEGVGHESSMISTKLPQVADLIRGTRLDRSPDSIDHTAFTPRRGAAHWIKMQDFLQPLKPARVQATRTDSRLYISASNVRDLSIDLRGWNENSTKTEILINSQLLTVPRNPDRPIVLIRHGVDGYTALPTEVSSFVIPKPKPVGGSQKPIGDLPKRVAEIVALRLNVHGTIMTRDLIAPQFDTQRIDEDSLLDIFFRYEDELFIAEIDRETYTAWRAEGIPAIPAWWGALVELPEVPEGNGPVLVAFPEVFTLMVDLPGRRTGLRLRRLIYDHVQQVGSLELKKGD